MHVILYFIFYLQICVVSIHLALLHEENHDHSREMQFEANPIEQLFVWNSRILSFISFFPLAI
jgi:hypothetical protein